LRRSLKEPGKEGSEGRGSEFGCAFCVIFHKDGICDVGCRQNLRACLIRGEEGGDIDIKEEDGCEMGDGLEMNSEAGNRESMRVISYVVRGLPGVGCREPFCMPSARSC
jgi:hypothetical protein